MTKIGYRRVLIKQTARFFREGSVLAGTASAGPVDIVTEIDVQSDESDDRIRHLAKMAEKTCFAFQTMINPVPATTSVTLNGKPLELK